MHPPLHFDQTWEPKEMWAAPHSLDLIFYLTEWRVRPIKTRRPSCGLSSSIFTSLHGCICILRKDSRSPLLHQPHDILNTIVTCVEWEECSSSNKAAHSNLQRHVHYFTFITSRSRWQHSQEDHGLLSPTTPYSTSRVSLSERVLIGHEELNGLVGYEFWTIMD